MCTGVCCLLQEDVEAALACTDVTQLDVSAIISVNDNPQHALRLRIKRQTKFLRECRDMKASILFLCSVTTVVRLAITVVILITWGLIY